MANKNPLNKFRGRPNFSFRFNPAEEDLLEELTTTEFEELPPTSQSVPLADSKQKSLSEDALPHLDGDDEGFTAPSSLSTSSSQSEVASQTPQSEKSSRDSSPLKESVKEYLTKVGKRSSSLDYSSDGERWSLSGIKGRIAKRIEEISKDAPFSGTLYRGSSFSGEKQVKLKESTSTNGVSEKGNDEDSSKGSASKSLTSRSRSSLDVHSPDNDNSDSSFAEKDLDDSSISVEEGFDCTLSETEQNISRDSDAVKSNFSVSTDTAGQTGKRSTANAVLTGAQSLFGRKNSPKLISRPSQSIFEVESVSLSSLKATRSFESELLAADEMEDLSSWEILDSEAAVEEKPETPLVFESKNSNEIKEKEIAMPTTLSQQAWDLLTTLPHKRKDFWLKPAVKKWLLSIIMALFAVHLAPLPSYFTGLFTGLLLAYLFGSALWWILQAPTPKEPLIFPNYSIMPPLRIPVSENGDTEAAICKGWMNELPTSVPYDPENFNGSSTHSVYVRLEGSQLRLSRPKSNISRRAMWNERKPNPVFNDQNHFKLEGATVSLPPDGLVRKRLWSKKYPICISLTYNATSTITSWLSKQRSLDEENSLNTHLEENKSSSTNTVLHLFARSCREKEEWHRRFHSAATGKPLNFFSYADSFPQTVEESVSSLSMDNCYSGESDEIRNSIDHCDVVRSPINYASYMGKYITQDNVTSQVRLSTSSFNESNVDSSPSDAWLNAFIGRVFYDFLTVPSWSRIVSERIQRKLSVIKVPYFMDELKLRDINLGTNLPVLHRSSPPVMDERGFWVDFDLTYNGTFQMTLETKLNLMRLKKDMSTSQNLHGVEKSSSGSNASSKTSKEEELTEFSPPQTHSFGSKSYLYNSDEEDSAESSSDEDISASEPSDNANEEGSSSVPLSTSQSASANKGSTSKKLLQWVDKITQSRYFQQATEIGYIKKAMAGVSKTPIVLTVEVRGLIGTLALNIPPPPTDRLWYGFRGNPQLSLTARPQLGEHVVTFVHIIDWIEKKLTLEFQKLLVMPNMDDLVIPIMEPGYSQSKPS